MAEPINSASNNTVYGPTDELIENWQFELTKDKSGHYKGTQTYYAYADNLADLIPAVGTVHPVYGFLYFDTFTGKTLKGGDWMEIKAEYVGHYINGGESTQNDPDDPIEFSTGMRITSIEEPLATNAVWEGIPARDIHEAVMLATNPPKDQDGKIKRINTVGWDAIEGQQPQNADRPVTKKDLFDKLRQGTTFWLNHQVEYFVRYTALEPPKKLVKTNTISEPPKAPDVGERNWLLTGYNITERSNVEVYDIEKVWLLSGPRGWDEDLYLTEEQEVVEEE